jgi:hypothetical protein
VKYLLDLAESNVLINPYCIESARQEHRTGSPHSGFITKLTMKSGAVFYSGENIDCFVSRLEKHFAARQHDRTKSVSKT